MQAAMIDQKEENWPTESMAIVSSIFMMCSDGCGDAANHHDALTTKVKTICNDCSQ